MMDSNPDETAEPGAITEDWDDSEEGPRCGTAEALTCLVVCFTDNGTMTSLHRHCCCFRHVPHLAEVLPEHAALVEIVLEDANGTTVVGPDGVQAGISEDGVEVPIHIPSIIPATR
jgi:hypothetical protein